MPSHNLKSSYRHPYQKFMVPFWRHSNLPVTMGYSADTIEMFERQKEAFDQGAKFIQWETRPAIQ